MHTMVDPDAPLLSEGFEGTWPPEGWAVASANDANGVTKQCLLRICRGF